MIYSEPDRDTEMTRMTLDEMLMKYRDEVNVEHLSDAVLSVARFFHNLTPAKTELGNLTLRKVEAIEEVSLHPGTTLQELADHLDQAKSTASQLVDRLVREEYLLRQPNPNNRREVLISISEKGQAYLDHRKQVVRENLTEMIATLSKQNRDRLLGALFMIGQIIQDTGERRPHEA